MASLGGGGLGGKWIDRSRFGTQKFNFHIKIPTPKFILQDFTLAISAKKIGENYYFVSHEWCLGHF